MLWTVVLLPLVPFASSLLLASLVPPQTPETFGGSVPPDPGRRPSSRAYEAAIAFSVLIRNNLLSGVGFERLWYSEPHGEEDRWAVFVSGISPASESLKALKIRARASTAGDVDVGYAPLPHRGEHVFVFSPAPPPVYRGLEPEGSSSGRGLLYPIEPGEPSPERGPLYPATGEVLPQRDLGEPTYPRYRWAWNRDPWWRVYEYQSGLTAPIYPKTVLVAVAPGPYGEDPLPRNPGEAMAFHYLDGRRAHVAVGPLGRAEPWSSWEPVLHPVPRGLGGLPPASDGLFVWHPDVVGSMDVWESLRARLSGMGLEPNQLPITAPADGSVVVSAPAPVRGGVLEAARAVADRFRMLAKTGETSPGAIGTGWFAKILPPAHPEAHDYP